MRTALLWAWSGYARARENELHARRRGADLRQALKALDEASYRLDRTNRMLSHAWEQADEAKHLKQQFAQTISHELRTPLNLIVGFTELMIESPEFYGAPLAPRYARDLSIVHRNARHLQGLVNDVLDLARIEATQMSLILETTDPETLVREAVATAHSLVEVRGLRLETEIEEGLPALRLDPMRIRQVLYNLLNNAARFTDEGHVSLLARRQDDEIIFTVADTGVGIAHEKLPLLFEAFSQLDEDSSRRSGGADLGLTISKGFVELHGGRIWAESEPGRGSAFSFALPITGDVSRDAPGPWIQTGAMPRREERLLLLITRSMSAASLLSRHLRNVRTVVVGTLERGRELAHQVAPQAVVIDRVSTPVTEDDLARLSEEWDLGNLPFVACHLSGEEWLRKELAIASYLIKPIGYDALWDVLRPLGPKVERILLVDDDQDFVRLMTRMLDSPLRRYEVISAYSGHEALKLIEYRRPDLILMDLGLPDIGGREVIRVIQGNPGWHDIPIVVISGQEEGDLDELLPGTLTLRSALGHTPGEVVKLIQTVMDAMSRA